MWGWIKKVGSLAAVVVALCAAGNWVYSIGYNERGADISAREQTISRLNIELESYKEAAKLNLPRSLEKLESLSKSLDVLSKKIIITLGAEETIKSISEENIILQKINKINAEKINKLTEIIKQYDVKQYQFKVFEKSSQIILGQYTISVEKIDYFSDTPTASIRASTNIEEPHNKIMRLNDKIEHNDALQSCAIILTSINTRSIEFTLICKQRS